MAKASRYPNVAPEGPLRTLADVVLRRLWDEMLSESSSALRGDEDAVHDMRVAIRRLRSALRTFRDCYPRELRRPVSRATRRLGRVMGRVRDADVHLAVLRTALVGTRRALEPGVEFVIERIGEQRGRALAEAEAALAVLDRAALGRMVAHD